MKKTLLFIFFSLSSLLAISQTNQKQTEIKSFDDIKYAFLNDYHPQPDSAKNSCWQGCVFIRFNINNKHQITNIAYTLNTPQFVQDGIMRVILKINKRGLNFNRLKNTSRQIYLLPFMVSNNNGCGFKTGWENDDHQNKLDKEKQLVYERRQQNYYQYGNSIKNITNFTDGLDLNQINCIILSAIIMPISVN